MARCTFEWENHGETLRCEVDGEHPQYPGDNGGTVDWHTATYTNPEGFHPDDTDATPGQACACSRAPECWGTVGPLAHTVGYCDPTLA